jgi:hypothetical protein
MKKITTLLFACLLMTKVFAGDSFSMSCTNITQGTFYNQTGIPTINVFAYVGDSLDFNVSIQCGTTSGPPSIWYFNGDTIPNTNYVYQVKIIVTQSATYTAIPNCGFPLLNFNISAPVTCGSYAMIHNYNQNLWMSVGASGYTSDTVLVNPGDSLEFFVHTMIGCNPQINNCDLDSISWTYNGNLIGNIQNDLCQVGFVFHDPGQYVARNRLDGSTFFIHYIKVIYNSLLAVSNIKDINFINVFPTAVTSSITIQLHSIKPNDIEISFYDMNGKQLKNDFYKNVFGEFIRNENTEVLAKGIYFLRIKTGDDIVQKKFVKL